MLSYNKSKITQLIYSNKDAYPIAIHPNMIVDLSAYKDIDHSSFAEFNMNCIVGADNLTIHRDYALGDLIQIVPVCRMLKKKLGIKNVKVITSDRFAKELSYIYNDIRFFTKEWLNGDISQLNFGFILSTNGILERDHSIENKENAQHRVFIYLDFFNLKNIQPTELDWSCVWKGGVIVPDFKKDKPLIGLQIRGSGCMKTLPIEMIHKIAEELSKDYYVILIDQDKDKGFEGKNIINLCGKLKSPQVIALLEKLDLCITMDSGVLWMCHSANCPTLTFLASTRESERITLHPQYPKKAKAIDLTKYIGCEPCFETRVRCGGKIRCMTEVNYDMIRNELFEKVKSILGV